LEKKSYGITELEGGGGRRKTRLMITTKTSWKEREEEKG
jgi:hypothetical protein